MCMLIVTTVSLVSHRDFNNSNIKITVLVNVALTLHRVHLEYSLGPDSLT